MAEYKYSAFDFGLITVTDTMRYAWIPVTSEKLTVFSDLLEIQIYLTECTRDNESYRRKRVKKEKLWLYPTNLIFHQCLCFTDGIDEKVIFCWIALLSSDFSDLSSDFSD